MNCEMRLKSPVFELGLKGYLFGDDALRLALDAERISLKYDVPIIFDPQHVDIPAIAAATTDLFVFAQHMDPVVVGRGAGRILPEALKNAGAHGTLLNHAENQMTISAIANAVKRASDVGLKTMVCADSPEQAAAIAQFNPDIILAEPPDLIGTGKSVSSENSDFITRSISMVKSVNPDIIVFNSAGIRTPEDVRDVMLAGSDGTGSTSGVIMADDPVGMLEGMVRAMREAWDERG